MMMSTQLSLIFFNRTTKTSGGGFLSFYFANWWFNFSMEYTSEKWAKEKVCWSEHLGSSSPRPQISQTSYSYTRADAVQGTYLQFEVKILVLCFPSYLFPLLHMARKAKIIWNDPLTEVPRVKHYFLFQLFDAMPSWLFLRFYLF